MRGSEDRIMAGTNDGRYTRNLRQVLLWVLAAAAVALGAIAAVLLTTGRVSAEPVVVPGIGTVELPFEVRTPAGITDGTIAVYDDGVPRRVAHEIEVLRVKVLAPDGMDASTPDAPVAAPVITPDNESAAPNAPPGFESPIISTLRLIISGIDPRSLFTVPGMPSVPGILLAPEMHMPVPGAPAAAPRKTHGELAVEAAESKLGSAYDYGSAGPDAFDCSGLVQWSYEQAGVEVPRTSYDQLNAGIPVGLDELEPGDLVSFYNGSHSALYAGDGNVIHAATEGVGVVKSPMSEMPVTGARRF
jgi:cell wall-associated NlpC family hydrolase